MSSDFWHGRRVLVTGHTGFKGAWLSAWLLQLGADVTGFSLPPETEPNLFDLLALPLATHSRFADVTDRREFTATARRADPEVFFHMAAQAQVLEGYRDPVGTFGTNVMGTVNALEIARNLPSLRAMLVVTSDKCYKNDGGPVGYREDAALGGDDPYSCSKACAELVANAYRQSYFGEGCAVATARAGNVFGGGDWSRDRLVPDIVRAIVADSPLRLRNPAATRPWQHVLEPLRGYLALAERLCTGGRAFAQAWNFGPAGDEARTVAELAASIFAAWKTEARLEIDHAEEAAEAQRLAVDASKARERLGWKPQLSNADAIAWTVEWYKSWHSGGSCRELTARQIRRYERTLFSEAAAP